MIIQGLFVTNYFQVGPTVFFPLLVARTNRILYGMKIFERVLTRPVKQFGEILPSHPSALTDHRFRQEVPVGPDQLLIACPMSD